MTEAPTPTNPEAMKELKNMVKYVPVIPSPIIGVREVSPATAETPATAAPPPITPNALTAKYCLTFFLH